MIIIAGTAVAPMFHSPLGHLVRVGHRRQKKKDVALLSLVCMMCMMYERVRRIDHTDSSFMAPSLSQLTLGQRNTGGLGGHGLYVPGAWIRCICDGKCSGIVVLTCYYLYKRLILVR